MRYFTIVFLVAATATVSRAAVVVQWDFNGSLEASTDHEPLVAEASPPAVAPEVEFLRTEIGVRSELVASFSPGTYFRASHGFEPNGGGSFVNQYTVIADVMYPAGATGWQCLLQTNENNANDADWCVQPNSSGSGLGISGNYGGVVEDGRWHRLALVVDLRAGTYTSYVDGTRVQQNTGLNQDGRFSLGSSVLFFADDNGETEAGFVAAIQLRDEALCDDDLAAFASPRDGALTPNAPTGNTCREAPGDLSLKEGPYLQWVTQNAMTVLWETTAEADSTVLYRNGHEDWREVSSAEARRIHEIRLDGFAPSDIVEYAVRSRAAGAEVESEVATFQTAPPQAEPFRFVVWGDNQGNPGVFGGLVRSMAENTPDLAVSVGDVVDNGTIYSQWGNELLTPLTPLAQSVPFFVAIGNHERNSHWFYDYLAQPGNEHWFSFDYAECHFVVIDTNFPFGPGSEQYAWLEEDLFSAAAQESKWLFAFHHHPPYSEIFEEVVYARARMHLVPLFEAAGVDVDFTGHIHDYERGVYVPPDTGRRIAYVQTSGGGGRLWEDEFDGEWEQIQRVIQFVYHYCLIEIEDDSLTLKAIDLNGRVIDSFTLEEAPRNGELPPPPPPDRSGEAVTQWDFTAGDLEPTYGPGVLEYVEGDAGETAARTAFGTTESFGIAAIGGQVASVMRFPRASANTMGLRVRHGAPGNRGSFVNEYTMVLDLYLPAISYAADDWLGIYNTNAGNTNDADVFVNLSTGGIGINGQYDGDIAPDTWHRVALVCAVEEGQVTLHKYIDGVEVGRQPLGGVDGRWSLWTRSDATPWFFLLTDDSGDATTGYVSSYLFVDAARDSATIARLGGADADGISEPSCGKDCEVPFVRGDPDGDGDRRISDAIFVLGYLFLGSEAPSCEKSADLNDSGNVDLTDAIHLLSFLFLGGEPPQPPLECGTDPTADSLTCEAFAPCS